MDGARALAVAATLLFAAGILGAPQRAAGKARPVTVPLKEIDLEPGLRLGFEVSGMLPKTGLRFSPGRRSFILVDLDGDRTLEAGTDGIVLTGHPFVVHLREPFLCEAGQCAVRVDGRETVTLTPEDLGLEERPVADASEVNAVRLRAGLPLVVIDPQLSADCVKHCGFLKRNGLEEAWKNGGVHFENRKLPGYTKEGERAGWGSAMHTGVTSYRESVLCWSTTVWHAIAMLHPRLRQFGAALEQRIAMFYCPIEERDAVAAPRLHPPDGARQVPRLFASGGGEEPGPFAGDQRRGAGSGHPLLVTLPPPWRAARLVEFSLVDERGHRVEGRSSAPSAPGQPKTNPANSGCALFLPAKNLAANRTFRATLRMEGQPPLQWSFTTGSN